MQNSDSKDAQSSSNTAMTGMDGRFQLNGVAPGDYIITAYLAGYLDASGFSFSESQGGGSLSVQALEKTLTRITVAPAQTTTVNLTLARGASLGGTVRYDDGGVASTATITLYRKDNTGKWNRFGDTFLAGHRMHATGFTDDRGRFYQPGLPTGSYIVEASLPQPASLSGLGIGLSSEGADSLRVFNGDKYRLKDAPAIELTEGEDRADVDIDIPTTGLNSLQGFVTAKPDGRAVTKGTISLLDPDDKSTLRETSIQRDGSFSLNLVASGNYIVQIAAQADDVSGGYDPLRVPLLVESDLTGLTYAVSAKRH